jgi:hypothetical protein
LFYPASPIHAIHDEQQLSLVDRVEPYKEHEDKVDEDQQERHLVRATVGGTRFHFSRLGGRGGRRIGVKWGCAPPVHFQKLIGPPLLESVVRAAEADLQKGTSLRGKWEKLPAAPRGTRAAGAPSQGQNGAHGGRWPRWRRGAHPHRSAPLCRPFSRPWGLKGSTTAADHPCQVPRSPERRKIRRRSCEGKR